MLSLTIQDTKNFMSQLLIKEVFDSFHLSEAVIKTANSYSISGEMNKDFFSEEEFNNLPDQQYTRWTAVKPFCFSLIKGNKVPSYMKIVFLLPEDLVAKLIAESDAGLAFNDINGLFFNIKYAEGKVSIVTGTSIKIFTMDKTLEHAFDSFAKSFLMEHGINFEEII